MVGIIHVRGIPCVHTPPWILTAISSSLRHPKRGGVLGQETTKRRFFYGYVVTAAGFVIWSIGWGTSSPSFSMFLKCLGAEFGWARAETSLAYSLAFLVQ